MSDEAIDTLAKDGFFVCRNASTSLCIFVLLTIQVSTASTPYQVFLLTDHPNRANTVMLKHDGFPMIFHPRVHGNETTFMILPPELHPRSDTEMVEVKRVFFCERRPLSFDTRTDQFLLDASLHFRGRFKDFAQFYRTWKHSNCICDDMLCRECLSFANYVDVMPEVIEKLKVACPQGFETTGAGKDDETEFTAVDEPY